MGSVAHMTDGSWGQSAATVQIRVELNSENVASVLESNA
jgi:hypothetical protein